MHIAMHSNAKTQNCGAGNSYGGTHSIYQYTSRKPLASVFRDKIGYASPGTNDKICYTPNCTNYNSLGELTQTHAPAAYVEIDYHTYQNGVDFLLNRSWEWRFGYAVDSYWGYPREPYVY